MPFCSIPGCKNKAKTFNGCSFLVPTIRNQENRSLVQSRIRKWKKLCGSTDADPHYRICSDHFFLKQPARLLDTNHPDWLPWLKINPTKPDDPVQVQQKMQQYYERKQSSQPMVCCIDNCINSGKESVRNLQCFNFPKLDSTNYVRRVLSEKRLLVWMQVIDQPDTWEKYDVDRLKVCSRHFATGKMALLTDVENVDWVPTVDLNRTLKFKDHVAHYDLYGLISLIKDSKMTDDCISIDDFTFPKAAMYESTIQESTITEVAATTPQPEPSVKVPKLNIGLKCILCLASTALKPLKPGHMTAINILFNDKLTVESELICGKCSKFVSDFYNFYQSIMKFQQSASLRRLKSVIPVAEPIRPVTKPIQPQMQTSQTLEVRPLIPRKKGGKLFEILKSGAYRCTLCGMVLAGKKGLNDHLYHAHKVKINCKVCKESFSPDGYADHKKNCDGKTKSDTVSQKVSTPTELSLAVKGEINKLAAAAVINVPKELQEKHSCYICMQYFTPEEMKTHMTTHGQMLSLPVFEISFQACKQCQKAVRKDDMEKHLKDHEAERTRMKERMQKQELQTHPCDVCNAELRTFALLQQHKKKHKLINRDDKIECPDCNRIVVASYYKSHCQMVHDNVLLPCDKCGKQMSRASLKRHRQTTCGDDALVPCNFCGKMMRSYLISGHVNKVHSSSTAKCSFCPKVYDSKDYAASHERWSHREEWEKRRRDRVVRIDADRGQLEELLGLKPNEEDEEEDDSTCPVCLNVHGTSIYIETHMRKAHSKEYIAMIMGGVRADGTEEPAFNAEEYLLEAMMQ